jgi:hypothetical protein
MNSSKITVQIEDASIGTQFSLSALLDPIQENTLKTTIHNQTNNSLESVTTSPRLHMWLLDIFHKLRFEF